MKRKYKQYFTYAMFFVAGSLVSGGVVFASSGSLVQALYESANIVVANNAVNIPSSQLLYNGISYINSNDLVTALNNAGVSTSWNGQSLTVSNLTPSYVPSVSSNTSSSSSSTSSPLNSNSVSLFDYPQFAEGAGDQPGTTTIYSSFVDNLGNRYLAPTMSWSLSSTAGSGATSNNSSNSSGGNLTLGNLLGQPYASQVLNQHVNYQTFHALNGTAGTFSKIYNLNGNFSYFTATLAPSAYFNKVAVNNNIGSLEIINVATGTALYYYNNISSNNSSPLQVVVPLYNVNQIEVIFNTDGVGLINPLLIKN